MDGRRQQESLDPAIEALSASKVSGSALTSALLDVFRRRAGVAGIAEVEHRQRDSRFVRSSPIDLRAMRTVEEAVVDAAPPEVEWMVLSPLAPFGAHAALAGVDQNRIVSATRGTEVVADPTVPLVLEAARRRRSDRVEDPRSRIAVSLGSIQRVVRAQRFDGPDAFAHFGLSALVTSGRGGRGFGFEQRAVGMHLAWMVGAARRLGVDRVFVSLSDFTDGSMSPVTRWVGDRLAAADVEILERPDRVQGRGYYLRYAFGLEIEIRGERIDVGDGGLVDWGARLLGDATERTMTSGIGLDRLASRIV